MDTTQLKRIADAMEEILRLVKEDQAQYKKEPEQSWPTGLSHKRQATSLTNQLGNYKKDT